jgi:trimethylamine:corrinoid methyltransferase-like protein
MGLVVPDPEADPLASMERPPIEPLRPAFATTRHTAGQLDRLKQATLDILETVGVQFQSEKALGVLAEHGVRVDRAAQIATFPPEIVLAAMAQAPRRFTLGARDPSCDIPVGDGNT